MARLEQAIAELAAKQGGAHAGGGDSMELPHTHIGGPDSHGVGMPGGTIGTHTVGFAPGEPTTSGGGVPKSGLAGASIGTEKSLHGPGLHRHHHHFGQRPAVDPDRQQIARGPGMPGATVGTKQPGATTVAVGSEPARTAPTLPTGKEPVQTGPAQTGPAVLPWQGPNTGPVVRLPTQVDLPDIPNQACGAVSGGEIVRKGLAGGTVGT